MDSATVKSTIGGLFWGGLISLLLVAQIIKTQPETSGWITALVWAVSTLAITAYVVRDDRRKAL